jgi:hypothetical protein
MIVTFFTSSHGCLATKIPKNYTECHESKEIPGFSLPRNEGHHISTFWLCRKKHPSIVQYWIQHIFVQLGFHDLPRWWHIKSLSPYKVHFFHVYYGWGKGEFAISHWPRWKHLKNFSLYIVALSCYRFVGHKVWVDMHNQLL